jgi:hypothetical protein
MYRCRKYGDPKLGYILVPMLPIVITQHIKHVSLRGFFAKFYAPRLFALYYIFYGFSLSMYWHK